MLGAESDGQQYSRAGHRRALQAVLGPDRTEQAIEYKHANISAAMMGLGLPYIRGYQPRGNYQAVLAGEIRRQLEVPQALTPISAARPVSVPASGQLRRVQQLSQETRRRTGRHVDYGLLQEESRRVGEYGEQLVVAYEQGRLRASGRKDLAGRVRWVAREDGDGLGYDILSFDAAGSERYIEVKTTGLGAHG